VTDGQNKNVPAVYTPCSGLEAPYNVETPAEAAMLIEKLLQLHLNSDILLAVPIPEAEAVESKRKFYCHLDSTVTKGAHESYV
jgi:pseudouridine-5'-phosphate glycosidase